MKTARLPLIVLLVLLAGTAGLMLGPMHDETATVDETTFMGGGYAYFKTGSCKMAEENPIFVQMLVGAPLLAYDVRVSEQARALMEQRAFYPVGWRWDNSPTQFGQLFPRGVNWYHYGMPESQLFGKLLVYDPQNDAERLMFAARLAPMLFTLATAILVFFWARQLAGDAWAGALAAALWALNPLALAYGHLAITEPGLTLGVVGTVWWFAKTARQPTLRNMFVLGAATAFTVEMKFLGLMLLPSFAVLGALLWWRGRNDRQKPALATQSLPDWIKRLALLAGGFWTMILIAHFPHWSPPPPIDTVQADALRVPGWFQALRPVLIPGDFFKAITLKLMHNKAGHESYLLGDWSQRGWWYYYPVAVLFKTPVPLLALTLAAAVVLVRKWRTAEFVRLVPWCVAALYLGLSLTSEIDIGVRHVLPLYPLLAVGVADVVMRGGRNWRIAGLAVSVWLAVLVVWAYPDFIPYCNVLAGGMSAGYEKLIDSNYDWGQDGKRLKQWMQSRGVNHVYLDFFGTQTAIEWLQIPNTRVNAENAHQIRDGVLVVSVSQLMRPEWTWLRQARQPSERIGYTLFVYRFP